MEGVGLIANLSLWKVIRVPLFPLKYICNWIIVPIQYVWEGSYSPSSSYAIRVLVCFMLPLITKMPNVDVNLF
jgi:hypothetical protein